MNKFFCDYSEYISRFFPDIKVQKISVNVGNTCPNRDGSIGHGGCIYCNNLSFTPAYCMEGDDLEIQIAKGKEFFARKYPEMKFLVYFQSFTNTYSSPEMLKSLYTRALSAKDVVGIVVGTRPDCLSRNIINILGEINTTSKVFIELGAETTHDSTLKLINRNHTFFQTVEAVRQCSQAGLSVGLHMIEGLPGESREMMLKSVDRVCELPVESLKFHHLQVITGTKLHAMFKEGAFTPLFDTSDEYLEHCVEIIKRVPRTIAIERFLASSPPSMVVSPRWGLKNYEFTNRLMSVLNNFVRME